MGTSKEEQYRQDIERLILQGTRLEGVLLFKYQPDLLGQLSPEDIKQIRSWPSFDVTYQSWYSEAISAISQVLPSRLADFRGHYEAPKGRKELDAMNYRIADCLNGLNATDARGKTQASQRSAIPHVQQQVAIVRVLRDKLKSSLYDMKTLVQADLYSNELEVAADLKMKGFRRAAGAVAGVVLEGHLKETCQKYLLQLPKKPTLSVLNDKLKDANVIDQPQWRNIQFLADIRNLCDHKDVEPTPGQIDDLIYGTKKVVGTVI